MKRYVRVIADVETSRQFGLKTEVAESEVDMVIERINSSGKGQAKLNESNRTLDVVRLLRD
jgi:hypothetical protein